MRALFANEFPNLRLDSGAPLLVLAPRDEPSMKALAPQMWKQKGAKPSGFFQHGWEKQFAMVQLDEDLPGAYGVVYHEYVHTLLHMNFRWLPLWLDEGLAEFYGNTRFEQSQMFVGAPSSRVRILQARGLIPLETLLAVNQSSPYYHDEDKVQTFYAESWALTHFLAMEKGQRLTEFYRLVQQGVDEKKAFQQVIGDFKEVEKNLDQYVHKLTMPSWVLKNPPQIDERNFTVRSLSLAETEAELGGYHLWSGGVGDARPLIEQALKNDPQLGLAHENMGFLDFAEGKDEEAVREFAQAYELDGSRYLSLFFKTMLSPSARSDVPADQASFHDALLKALQLNSEFAPPYTQLARLDVRQGKLTNALAVARKAEQLEPSRAGYHLLSGRIMLRMGQGTEAATMAKYVADHWYGADHDEAVELWDSVPATQRPIGDHPRYETVPQGAQTVEGRVESVTCGDKDEGLTLVLDHDGQSLSFHGAKGGWHGGFPDTIWYGEDHFSFCHHVEGMRAVVTYKPSSDKIYAGDLAELELREDLPASLAVSKTEEAKPEENR